jgi:hypothetical protein
MDRPAIRSFRELARGQGEGAQDGSEAGRRTAVRTTRRSTIVGVAIGLPLSAVLLWLATRDLDTGRLWQALRSADPAPLALLCLCMAAVYLAQAERWRTIARPESDRPRHVYLALVIGAVAANNLIPGRPGEALRAYWLARSAAIPFGRALATVVVDRAGDALVLAGLLFVVVPFVDVPTWLSRLVLASAVLALLIAAALVCAWIYARRSGSRAHQATIGLRPRLRRVASGLVRGTAAALRPAILARAIGLSLVSWGAFAVGVWAAGAALDLTISPLEALFVTAVVNLGVAIPSSPGFVGTYQWLAIAALGLFSVSRTDAFALSILLHASWFVPTTLAGLGLAAWAGASWRPASAGRRAPAGDHVV